MIKEGKVLGEYELGLKKGKHLYSSDELSFLDEEDINNIKYIVDNPTDALYYDWFCHKRYYRLPNRLKTWWKVFKFKWSENRYSCHQHHADELELHHRQHY